MGTPLQSGRLFVHYTGEGDGDPPCDGWVDRAVLSATSGAAPAGPLPSIGDSTLMLENRTPTMLWMERGASRSAFGFITRPGARFRLRSDMQTGCSRRAFVQIEAQTGGWGSGFAWVDRSSLQRVAVLPADDGEPSEPPPLISPLPRGLPHGTGLVVRRLETSAPIVALTLDDAVDDEILDQLARLRVKVSLFLSGNWLRQHPAIARRAVEEGHELGNHTWSHRNLTQLPTNAILDEVRRAGELIQRLTGHSPIPALRPPYGESSTQIASIAAAEGYDLLGWDAESESYRAESTPDRSIRLILARARAGSIVLMHAMNDSDRLALTPLVAELRARGLEPGRLSDLAYSIPRPVPPTPAPFDL